MPVKTTLPVNQLTGKQIVNSTQKSCIPDNVDWHHPTIDHIANKTIYPVTICPVTIRPISTVPKSERKEAEGTIR